MSRGSLCLWVLVCLSGTSRAGDPCDANACCVDPATCVVTDTPTLAGLTIDALVPGGYTLGAYCAGGNGLTGLAPANWPANLCGLSFSTHGFTPAEALDSLDHKWLQSLNTPKVVDFGSAVNTVLVFVAVDHGPFPEEGIESTVWGSDSCDIASFPSGWTLATLTTIWQKGWEDPPECQGQDNADDFVGQYSFAGGGFRYVAVHANNSISIFQDLAHTSWTAFEDNSGVPGWQSSDDEIDAIGTFRCAAGTVTADAGADQIGSVGQQVCFDGSNSFAENGIANMGWDLDGDNEIDVSGTSACLTCDEPSVHEITLFVTDECGAVDADTVVLVCIEGEPCTTLNFTTEDDLVTPLVNGQHIDSEFGLLVDITSSGPNAGLGIFDSTPGGPNDPSQDLDLLVDTGNVLILQTENLPPDGNDVFPRPNDDEDGGTIVFSFVSPIAPMSLNLIDVDASDGTSTVVLTDGAGRTRTYSVPSNWTGDFALGQPGVGTLDLTVLAPQAGFDSTATAVEQAGFDAADVERIDVHLQGSGALDDLIVCTPGAGTPRGSVSERNGSGVNPRTLHSLTGPHLGGSWAASLDCSAHGPGVAFLFGFSAPALGIPTSFGELLVTGQRYFRMSEVHSTLATPFAVAIPNDISLYGLTVHVQGACGGSPGAQLSNAIDMVLGF